MFRFFRYIALLVGIAAALPAAADKELSAAQQRKFDYYFYEGLKLKQDGKYDAAYDLFNYCLEIDSMAAPVLYELSSFYVQMNKADRAVEMLRRAAQDEPENFTYQMALANVSRNLGMFTEAAEQYEKLAREYPEKPELYYYLGESRTQEGELGKAIEAYDALENIMGMNEALSMQKFKLYASLNEEDKAFAEIEKLAAKYPGEARYQLLIGDLYLEKKEHDKALKAYQRAHEIDPADPRYIVSMANYYEATGDKAAAEQEIRNALVSEGLDVETKVGILSRYVLRLQQSRQGLESANTLFETLIDQHPEDVDLKLMFGSLLLAQDKKEEARFQFELATEIEPTNDGAWKSLLQMAIREENIGEVVRICQRCTELFPEAPEYYFYLGIGYFQQEKYDDALTAYRAGLKVIPKENLNLRSDFYGQIGDIYYQIKNLPEAYKAYDEALKYNADNVVVLNNYSYFLTLEKKDLKKAERMIARCIQLEPDNATYLDTYAWVFFTQGNYVLAKIYIENAISKDTTESADLVDHYGDILYMNGNKEKALEQWKKAAELGKDTEVLREKIEKGEYIEDKNAAYNESF